MDFYVGVALGLYRHQMYGIWTNVNEAKRAIEEFAMSEPDDYHEFELLKFNIDSPGLEVLVSTLKRTCIRDSSARRAELVSQEWRDEKEKE